MKTVKLFVASAFIVAAITAAAVERPKVNLIPVNTERAIVAVNNEKAAHFELGIYSSEGEMVYYKQSAEMFKDYSEVFDFTHLDKGNYVLSLKINDTHVTNDFEVTREGIKVGEKKVAYAPYFVFENNALKLSYLNFEKEKMKLAIYNDNGLVYEAQVGRDFNITKGFDLSQLNPGTYKVVLHSFEKAFSYRFEK